LADALTVLATTLTEILTEKLQAIGQETERKVALKTADAMLTKQEIAKHFGITERTVENWMDRGYVPFLRIGRNIRFSLADGQRHVETRHRVCRLRV
jgi:excisionase family DNA binding protein